MGQAKRRRQRDPNYGQPLLYEALFFDDPHEPAFSIALEVARRGNRQDQLVAAIHSAEKLQWCLTWRDRSATEWRMANTESGAFFCTAKWVADQLNRKLTNVNQQLDWAPELAAREVQRIGFSATTWTCLLENLANLDQTVWLWELWPPPGDGDGYFCDECLYRAFQGRNMAASQALRADYPMAGDLQFNEVRIKA